MKKLIIILILFLFSQLLLAQERIVKGIVKDSTGFPIPGANVIVKGTSVGTQTDMEGKFSIKAVQNQILVVSFVGMKTENLPVIQNEINITLFDEQKFEPDCDEESISVRPLPRPLYQPPGGYKKNNPRSDFKRDLKAKQIIIYLVNASVLCKIDHAFEKKFGIHYYRTYFSRDEYEAIAYNRNENYTKAYNKLVFKYLNKKFKKDWHTGIRKEAVGLEEILK